MHGIGVSERVGLVWVGRVRRRHREMSLLPEIRKETHPAKNEEGR